jgi:hypothetical protein
MSDVVGLNDLQAHDDQEYHLSISFCPRFNPWIIIRIDVFEAKGANCCYLRDVFARFGPVKMGCVPGQNDYGTRRIGLQLVGVELFSQADVERAGDNCVNPVLWMTMGHQLHTFRHFDPDRVRAGLSRFANYNRKACRRRK